MKKIKVLAVAMACLASTTFAAGNLWDFNDLLSATNCGSFCGQVHTPGAIYCWKENPPTAANGWGKPCFDGTGGWWFGYADAGGKVQDAVSNQNVFVEEENCETNQSPANSVGTIAIEKYIDPSTSAPQNVDWIPNTVVGSVSKPGHYMVKGYGLGNGTEGFNVKFINPGGTDDVPNVSAIGFNWRQKVACDKTDLEGFSSENIKAQGTGLCIVYKADKAGVDVELGWNEDVYEYNTWIVKLPAASSWTHMEMLWSDFAPSYVTEDDPYPLDKALTEAEALKFALKTKTATPETINFQLQEVGWAGSCTGPAVKPDPTPIMGGKIASAYKFNMNGKMLSANFAGSIQIVNLHGAVVAKKTLAANESMSLANLPSGIYMVRSEKFGVVQKIIVK